MLPRSPASLPHRIGDPSTMVDIVTLTPNPAIDLSTSVEKMVPSRKLRCVAAMRDPGGGGINVARVIKRFGGTTEAIYPAGAEPQDKDWNLDTFMKAAEACFKGGNPFGIGLGTTSDNVDTIGAIFHSFGAVLVNEKGDIVLKNDQVRQALDYYKKLMSFLPPDVPAWDDASNNKFLVSGQGAMIMNPPSAWAVAKRDAPKVAEQCWTHGFPAGPKGRYAPFLPYFWAIWSFSKNKSAAKELLHHLMERQQIEERAVASEGFNLPPQMSMVES